MMSVKKAPSKGLNILLWILQGLLCASFLSGGGLKLFLPPADLAAMFPWTAENGALVMVTGILDLLAGIGIVLPMLLRIYPRVTALTAVGMLTLMGAAIVFHLSRGEAESIGFNIVMAVMAGVVAWGRRGGGR